MATGIAANMIGDYETARKLPPLDKILNLANALEVAIASLTGDTRYNTILPVIPDPDDIIFEYRFKRAKKLLVYLDPMVSSFDDYALEINDQGNVVISSAEKIVYKNGCVSTYGPIRSIAFKDAKTFVDTMELAESNALYQQIPLNQALNQLVDKLIQEYKAQKE